MEDKTIEKKKKLTKTYIFRDNILIKIEKKKRNK